MGSTSNQVNTMKCLLSRWVTIVCIETGKPSRLLTANVNSGQGGVCLSVLGGWQVWFHMAGDAQYQWNGLLLAARLIDHLLYSNLYNLFNVKLKWNAGFVVSIIKVNLYVVCCNTCCTFVFHSLYLSLHHCEISLLQWCFNQVTLAVSNNEHSYNKGKGKVHVLAIALLICFFKTRSALQSWKWQLIGMS